MKIAEIKEIPTNDLVERVEAEVTNYNQMVLNHSISPQQHRFSCRYQQFQEQTDRSVCNQMP